MIIGVSGKISSGKDTVGKIIQYLTEEGDWENYDDFNNYYAINLKEETFKWQIKKYAGKLKQIVSLLTGIPVEDFEKEEVKNSYLGEEWNTKVEGVLGKNNIHKVIVREFLQKLGTECMRNIIHTDVWVNALFSEYKEEFINKGIGNFHDPIGYKKPLGFPNWIITDVRFPNEADAIIERGGVLIRVERPVEIVRDRAGDGSKRTIEKFDENNESHIRLRVGHNHMHPSETSLDDYKGFKYLIKNDSDIETLVKSVKQILYSEEILKV